jgi:hypothetical protein
LQPRDQLTLSLTRRPALEFLHVGNQLAPQQV